MHHFIWVFITSILLISSSSVLANNTQHIPQLDTKKVIVWETIIYPSAAQKLKMHRHEHDRVVIALTDGILKITTNKGKIQYLKLQKEKAYLLKKNIPGELHADENMTSHLIKVFVIELKD